MKNLSFPFIILLLLVPVKGFSFAENITHGYPSCIACHASPTGGNMLTDYGRSLSKELMSTWGGWKDFEEPLFGAFKSGKTVKFGGDVRTIQAYRENESEKTGTQFLMQNNIEVGVTYGNVTFVGSAGTVEGPEGRTPNQGEFLSERHYLLWSPSPTSRLRVGKFRQRFGINDPYHRRLVKQLFGFGALTESYNVEFTKIYESYEVAVSSSLGRIDLPRNGGREKNISASFAHYLSGKSQLGGSVLLGESSALRRFLGGVFGVLPLSEKWLTLFELDYQEAQAISQPQSDIITVASSVRVMNRAYKGVQWYGVFEHSSQDTDQGYQLGYGLGLGIQWLPLPHFEIHTEYQRKISSLAPSRPDHVGWVVFHLYPF